MTAIEQDGVVIVSVPTFPDSRWSPAEAAKNATLLLRKADLARQNRHAKVALDAVGYPGMVLDVAEAVEWAKQWFGCAAEAVANECPVVQPDALVA